MANKKLNFHLSSKGHFPVTCLTGEICYTYSQYLKTEHWQNVRSSFYATKKPKGCNHCKANNRKIHLHHQTYERIGRESLNDFLPLCEFCHNFLHEFLNKKHRLPEPHERGNYELLNSKSIEARFHKKKPIKPPKQKGEAVMEHVKRLFGEISKQDVTKLFKINDLKCDLLLCISAIQYPSDKIKLLAEHWKNKKTIERCIPAPEILNENIALNQLKANNDFRSYQIHVQKGILKNPPLQKKVKHSKFRLVHPVNEVATWFPDERTSIF